MTHILLAYLTHLMDIVLLREWSDSLAADEVLVCSCWSLCQYQVGACGLMQTEGLTTLSYRLFLGTGARVEVADSRLL